jgi:hypothetical protein
MAMFGSSWSEGSEGEEIGPFSHWLEDLIEDDEPMVPSSWKEEPDNWKELCFQLRRSTSIALLSAKRCLKDNDWDIDKAYENHHIYMWDRKLK